MKYRDMSEEMTSSEILHILQIVFPNTKIKRYVRDKGYIMIYYSLPYDDKVTERRIDFLPNDIYIVGGSKEEPLDGVPLEDGEILYRYRQFMIARGYSEYWLDNPYVF